jgi:hypothetical protein
MLFVLLAAIISMCSVVFGDDVEDLKFSPERSFQTKEFSLTLSTKSRLTGTVSIKYTIAYTPSDMLSLQSPPAGTLYTTPILINRTCMIRNEVSWDCSVSF